ncbi:hypothetical protein GCM10017600_52800 [Streptosporangium carneum]|uniref:Uncharacterized protein n=1 Tax=Streptosporangium carneum TaxID=47481 RepID=A0A9W6I551_9ACTN|nr:hypothetical protein GCM10017600_52800 [Streptosporangium carneum]
MRFRRVGRLRPRRRGRPTFRLGAADGRVFAEPGETPREGAEEAADARPPWVSAPRGDPATSVADPAAVADAPTGDPRVMTWFPNVFYRQMITLRAESVTVHNLTAVCGRPIV